MFWRLCASLLLSAVAAAVGCGPVEENVPNISRFNSQPPLPPRTGPGSGGGGSSSSGAGGDDDSATVCNGGPAAYVGVECEVSFEADIYPILRRNCAEGGSCHSNDNKLGAPLKPDLDASAYWRLFTSLPFRDPQNNNVPYVNICSTDPNDSGISCNVAEAAGCGSPMPPRTPANPALTEDNLALLEEWLKCGAPNN